MLLRPDPVISPDDVARGKRALVKDAAWASLVGALYGGVILVGFALELGATPFIIGLLAAIPFLAQVAQLPAIALVERLRQRRKIAVVAVSISRLAILALAVMPLRLRCPRRTDNTQNRSSFELKDDGYRAIVRKHKGEIKVLSRRGKDFLP